MPIKKCPDCGLSVGGDETRCPRCGAPLLEITTLSARPKKSVCRLGQMRFRVWDLLFLLLCNLSFVLILINVIAGKPCWCQYPVPAAFAVYFFAFACAAGNIKRFLTRYRNAILILNFVTAAFELILRAVDPTAMRWAFDYFIPCDLTLGCIVMLCLLIHPGISVRNVLFSMLFLFTQSTIQFVLMLCGVNATERIPAILVSVAFGVNLISLIDIVFLYLIKFRDRISETFRLWE